MEYYGRDIEQPTNHFRMNHKWYYLLLGLVLLTGPGCKTSYQLKSSDARQYLMNSEVPADSSIIQYLLPYRAKLDSAMSIVIGTSAVDLVRQYNAHETTMGNFFCDALLAVGRELDPSVQIAFGTKGGLRADIARGPVTISNMFELMPFENTLVSVTITGEDFERFLTHLARSGGQPIAGMTLTLTSDGCKDVMIQGKPFDRQASYTFISYDYLVDGGDGIEFFSNPVKITRFDLMVRDALIRYVRSLTASGKAIHTVIDNRIKDERK